MVKKFPKKLLIASPHGFCAGVKRAIETLEQVLNAYPNRPVYCYHEIVHNYHIVSRFEGQGVKFVNNLDEVPINSILVFSAHGVSPALIQAAQEKQLTIIDATCPFVQKTHQEVKMFTNQGVKIIYVGRKGHDEAVGTVGEAPENTVIIEKIEEIESLDFPADLPLALVTQTTLAYNELEDLRQALRKRFPNLIEPPKSDICLATQNRQTGIKELIKEGAQAIVVIGSTNSSNSKNLKKISQDFNTPAYLINDATELNPELLKGLKVVGLSAGASSPEDLILETINWFKKHGVTSVEKVTVADEDQIKLAPANLPQ